MCVCVKNIAQSAKNQETWNRGNGFHFHVPRMPRATPKRLQDNGFLEMKYYICQDMSYFVTAKEQILWLDNFCPKAEAGAPVRELRGD